MARTPEVPDGSWPITEDDKAEIQKLGRGLVDFIQAHFVGQDHVHIKILAGAFQYVMELQAQKSKIIGDDFILAERVIKRANLSEKIEEPFTPAPRVAPETTAEKRARLQKEIEILDQQEEVEAASPAPTTGTGEAPAQG